MAPKRYLLLPSEAILTPGDRAALKAALLGEANRVSGVESTVQESLPTGANGVPGGAAPEKPRGAALEKA